LSAEPLGAAPSQKPPAAIRGRARLGPSEAAVFETFVVPRYLSLFGELALEMMVESEDAQIVHLHCRTGYPDRGVVLKLPGAHLVGVDSSAAALELARAKAATMPEMVSQYWLAQELPTSLPSSAFSHALALHPLGTLEDRNEVLGECARLLAPHGQAVVAMPVRGSFQELLDLLREYALKYDDVAVGQAAEQAELTRPTAEALGQELEALGFDFIELAFRRTSLRFRGGRDFFEDPITRLVVVPELRLQLSLGDREEPLTYVREAIDTYWSDGNFDLTVNIGCATGRKVG